MGELSDLAERPPSALRRVTGKRAPTADPADERGAAATSPELSKFVAMREELRSLWTRTNVSAEQAVADLQAWCKQAEESGIEALREFSLKLRAAKAA